MWWQIAAALGSLLIGGTGATVGALAFRRTSHQEDVEARIAAVEAEAKARTEAAEVGLKYLERSLEAQQKTITRQEGELGIMQGRLDSCQHERQLQDVRIADQAEQIAELRRAIQ